MCYRPKYLVTREMHVPCGKCYRCVMQRVSSWSARLQEEEKVSSSAYFITLTYNDENVPSDPNGRLVLCKEDLQLFHKRLRRQKSGSSTSFIKYYTCGEYGGHTQRPHYHSIIFNVTPELIQKTWQKGEVYFGTVTGASIGYCLKYMCKPKRVDLSDPRPREFALMSKGLGLSYVNEIQAEWHAEELLTRCFFTLPGGIKIPLPRYYKDKLYFELEKSAIGEANRIIHQDKELIRLDKQSFKQFVNRQKAIDASFDRMYKSSLKTIL